MEPVLVTVLIASAVIIIMQAIILAKISALSKQPRREDQQQPRPFERRPDHRPNDRRDIRGGNDRPQQHQRPPQAAAPQPPSPPPVSGVDSSLRDINLRLRDAERTQERERQRMRDGSRDGRDRDGNRDGNRDNRDRDGGRDGNRGDFRGGRDDFRRGGRGGRDRHDRGRRDGGMRRPYDQPRPESIPPVSEAPRDAEASFEAPVPQAVETAAPQQQQQETSIQHGRMNIKHRPFEEVKPSSEQAPATAEPVSQPSQADAPQAGSVQQSPSEEISFGRR